MKKSIKAENAEKDNPYHVSYENYLDTNACTECTGLMPNGADGLEEWEAFREIFDFIPQAPPMEDRDR